MLNLRSAWKFASSISPFRWLVGFGTLAALLTLGSCLIETDGCRRKADPPAEIPGGLDLGAPVVSIDGAPVATEQLQLDVAVPKASDEQAEADRKKYGVPDAPRATQRDEKLAPTSGSGIAGSIAAAGQDAAPTPAFEPIKAAEERFGPGPAGDSIDVAAWLLSPGAPIDLRGVWLPYQRPAPAELECPDGGFFGNEKRWTGTVAAGVLGVGTEAGLGGWATGGYRGYRAGLTLGADGLLAFSPAVGEPIYGVGFSLSK